jgi:hypothetical protein
MMRNRLLTTLLLSSALLTLAEPSTSAAQQPKMDIKLFLGFSGTTFVSMLESGRERETFAGWQIGFGPRLRKRTWFVEVLFSFNRWAFSLTDAEGVKYSGGLAGMNVVQRLFSYLLTEWEMCLSRRAMK